MILVRRIPMAVTDVQLSINQDLRALQPLKSSGVDAWYLFAFLQSVENSLLARTHVTGNGGRSLPVQALLDLEVPIPPPDVKSKIEQVTRKCFEVTAAAQRLHNVVGGIFPAALADVFGEHGGVQAADREHEGE